MSARRYRLRVYDAGAEVLTDMRYAAVLDLDGPGAHTAAAQLDDLADALARADGARGERIGRYYLAVHHWDSGDLECHWPAKTPPERHY